ncbi:unnamed protein product, partial [Ectocarpus sp. 12 AP-2014]
LAYRAVSSSSSVPGATAVPASSPAAASAATLGGGPAAAVASGSDSPRGTLGVSYGGAPASMSVGLPSAVAQRLAAQQQQQQQHSYSNMGSVVAGTGVGRSMNEGYGGVG